jgi:putative transposase
VVELDPDREAWNKLKLLCSISSKLWNEVNYARRRQFFETKRVDLRSTYKEFYERYKTLIGSATAQQVLNKNDEAWRSFFGLLKARKEGRLPPFMRRVSPPGYKKRGGFRILWTVLRKDQYRIEGDRIVIKGLGAIGVIVVEYRGLIHVRGEQGRLEIRYDPDRGRWYAHISFSEVREKLVRGSWVEVPRKPRGSLEAGVDIGVNNLMAVYVEDGRAFLVNGRPLKGFWFHSGLCWLISPLASSPPI